MPRLAGGGTFATLPALIALGLPANIANATTTHDAAGRPTGSPAPDRAAASGPMKGILGVSDEPVAPEELDDHPLIAEGEVEPA